MEHDTINNIKSIEKEIQFIKKDINIIAVTKTFPIEKINPLIQYGQIHFGENKVQEAINKWTNVKKVTPNLKLHMIGKLQTNKVKFVIPLFDYIHSLDSDKLAEKISIEQKKNNKNLKIFIQVNIGDENQKSGIKIENLNNFYKKCVNDLDLNIVGLMCIPPKDFSPNNYFLKMSEITKSFKFKELSMGMSSDYIEAINHGATFVRIGSKIFGKRS